MYHLTKVSSNRKTGPIPVSTTTSDSCPPTCSLKGAGCYAEQGHRHLVATSKNQGREPGGVRRPG